MTLKLGDRVGYAKKFLKSVFTPATDETWRMRGTVVEIKGKFAGSTLIKVQWDGEGEPMGVLKCNLAKPGTHKFC